MKIHNIRHGFATNSSSSHSIIILPRKGYKYGPTPADGSYGWDEFTLTDLASKQDYFKTQVRQMTGQEQEDGNYVDHQSVWGNEGLSIFDRLTRSPTTSPAALHILHQLISMDRVIILGGNDNSDGHPLLEIVTNEGAVVLSHRDSWTVVQDPKGHFVLFKPDSGTKYRISLDDTEPTKGTWPELIDIKITDYCSYGCSYCYQGSTVRGSHASLERLRALAARCNESGVLEVALGGGEPTQHPEFEQITRAFCSAGVLVNVTSRNVDFWATNPDIGVTAVAFSVDTARQVSDIIKKFSYEVMPERTRFEIHFQVVVGAVSNKELKSIMEACQNHRLTLLGYKDTGRGEDARKGLPICNGTEQTDWINGWAERVRLYREYEENLRVWRNLRELELYNRPFCNANDGSREREWSLRNPMPDHTFQPNVAIDTTLAYVCKDRLGKAGVPPITYHTEEGAFSMYIDAVSGKIGPSSYAPKHMVDLNIDTLWDDFANKVPTLSGGNNEAT